MNRNELIEKHIENVTKAARHYYAKVPHGKRGLVTMDDLLSAGHLALVEAARDYDPEKGAAFGTYAYHRINWAIFHELIFCIGKDALYLDDDAEQRIADGGISVEEAALPQHDIDTIPEREKARIVRARLKEFGLTTEETRVYLAVAGVGREKVTNLSALAREMKKREFEIRRIRQSAERKIRNAGSATS